MGARRCDWLRCAMLLAALALSSADDDKCRITVFTKNDKDKYKSDVVVSLSDPCDKTDKCVTLYSKEDKDKKKPDEIMEKKDSPNKDGKCPCAATLDDKNPKLFCDPKKDYCWVPCATTVWGTVESECKPDAKFGCRKYDTKEYDDTSSSCPATKKDDDKDESKSPPKGDSSPSKKPPPSPKSKSGENVTEPSTMDDGAGVRMQSNVIIAAFTVLMSTFAIFAL